MTNAEIESCIQTLRLLENTFLDDHGMFLNDKHPDNIEKIIIFLHQSLESQPCVDCVLDKIRAEIMQLDNDTESIDYDYNDMTHTEIVHMICREEVLRIIDKYKAESEE